MACATPWPTCPSREGSATWPMENSSCSSPFDSSPVESTACVLPARSDENEDSWLTELDHLTRILADCHLHEKELCGAAAVSATEPPGSACAATGIKATADVHQWADELLKRLQCCASIDEGRALCSEALTAFHRCQVETSCSGGYAFPHADRLQKLQGANKVIVQALRSFSKRHAGIQARCQQTEEANAQLAEQLKQCQERLKASERAKANLQSHLQLMNSSVSESAFHPHLHGPCN